MDKCTAMDATEMYRIEVQGSVPLEWSDRLGGMQIEQYTAEDGASRSALTGEVVDQAALMGVLGTLYTLQLPLRLVKCVEAPVGSPEDCDTGRRE
jgi:hypothetical protein